MANLIIEQHGNREAGSLVGRVLIGRWPDNSVVIDDNAVSRIHAWIGVQDGRYYIADAGSRTGTIINGQRLQERHVLNDGDEIRIGPAILTYRAQAMLDHDATEIDLSPRTPTELSGKHGVFMDCICGAPLWLPSNFAGIGQCRYCGHTVTQGASPALVAPLTELLADSSANNADDEFEAAMNDAFRKKATPIPPANRRVPPPAPMPRPTSGGAGPVIPSVNKSRSAMTPVSSTATLTPVAPAPSCTPTRGKGEKEPVCGVCHAPITLFDDVSNCPACGLGFHADCWEENHGCSAYGCSQVGAVGKNE